MMFVEYFGNPGGLEGLFPAPARVSKGEGAGIRGGCTYKRTYVVP